MSIQLGSAFGKVSIDSSGVTRGVKSANRSLESLAATGIKVGQALQGVGKAMTIGLTLPILALGGASIKMATDFEETKNKSLVVFGEMSDGIIKNSEEAARALGVSKTQYLDYASSVGAALTAGGMGIKEATELSEQAVKHFADLASFHNTKVEDAAAAWGSAIRGQYEPIQKYFPFITNEYLKTYGVANGMLDANTKNLNANQRAAILNAIALDEKLNPALDDFAETSGGLANQGRIMEAQFKDTLVMLGQNLLPIALEVATAFNSMLEKFNKMSPVMQKAVLAFAGFLAILGPIVSMIGTLIVIASSLTELGITLAGLGISFASIGAAISAAGTALAGFLVSAAAILGPILLIIATLGLLYWAFKNNFGGITTTAKQLWALMKIGFKEMWKNLKAGTAEGLESLSEAWDEWIENNQGTFERWGEWMRTAWQNILDYFAKARDYIVKTFQGIDWAQLGKNILLGLANGMLGGIPSIISATVAAAKAVMDSFDNELDMGSPSREMRKRGQWSVQGYMQGMQQEMNPNEMARTMAQPALQGAGRVSQQQTISMEFASGLTVRQVAAMIAENNDELLNGLARSLSPFGA